MDGARHEEDAAEEDREGEVTWVQFFVLLPFVIAGGKAIGEWLGNHLARLITRFRQGGENQ